MVVLLGNRRADICWGNEALRFDYFVFSIAVFAQVNLFRLSCLNGRLDTHKIFKISSGFVAILSCPLRFNIGRRVDSRFWRWCGYDSSVLSINFFFSESNLDRKIYKSFIRRNWCSLLRLTDLHSKWCVSVNLESSSPERIRIANSN